MANPTVPGVVRLLAGALVAGSSLVSLSSCTSARAVSIEVGRLDQVRLGFGLDPSGAVGAGCAASTFAQNDPIHLSVHVTDAIASSVVSVSVRDIVTNRVAWREDRSVPPGGSFQTFEIGRGIALGSYRAESTLGGKAKNPRPFVVHAKRKGAR